MADIDLIPHDYRTWLTQQAMLRRYVSATVVLNIVFALAGGLLQFSNSNAESRLEALKAENAITQQQQIQLEQLQSQQAEYEKQLSLLHG
ncbi:MAG: hypothetical protein HKN35_01545, partial [Woeseia sp.]|nr:hypothetical protein [Woeseia sp.]